MTCQSIIPDTARIGRTALVVSDLEEMTDFYRDIVGLTVQTQTETTAMLGTDETPLLVLNQDEDTPSRSQAQAGLFHNAFKLPSHATLGAALDRIREHWQLDGAADHYVSEALYLTDPEGNGVEIYTDQPKAEWPRADDGTVEIGTAALDLADIAAQSDGTSKAPSGTVVGHVHVEVTSIEAARTFYAETLGLCIQTESPAALFLAAGDYHHHLGANAWNGRSQPAGGRGLAWFEFIVPDDSLSTIHRRLRDADIRVTERTDSLEITDPSGIPLRIRGA